MRKLHGSILSVSVASHIVHTSLKLLSLHYLQLTPQPRSSFQETDTFGLQNTYIRVRILFITGNVITIFRKPQALSLKCMCNSYMYTHVTTNGINFFLKLNFSPIQTSYVFSSVCVISIPVLQKFPGDRLHDKTTKQYSSWQLSCKPRSFFTVCFATHFQWSTHACAKLR